MLTRGEFVRRALVAVDQATACVLTDHIVRNVAEAVVAELGAYESYVANLRAGEAVASLASDALGIGGSGDDEGATCWSLRDELLDELARAQAKSEGRQ